MLQVEGRKRCALALRPLVAGMEGVTGDGVVRVAGEEYFDVVSGFSFGAMGEDGRVVG